MNAVTPVVPAPALASQDDVVRLVWNERRADPRINDNFVVLSPVPKVSCGKGPHENLIIEGDNWDGLRWLRMAYRGSIRCILIDPPYNTGSTGMAYDDRFEKSTWLSWLRARLEVARDLLTDDGVMMVCIDDARRAHLELLMEQVMPGRRAGSIVWRSRQGGNDGFGFNLSVDHEHVMVWAMPGFKFGGSQKSYDMYSNPDNDPRGDWRSSDMTVRVAWDNPRAGFAYYPIHNPRTGVWYPANPDAVWCYTSGERLRPGVKLKTRTMEQFVGENKVIFPDDPPANPRSRRKPVKISVWNTKAELMAAIDAGDVPRSATGAPMLRRGLPDLDKWVGRPCGWGVPQFKRHKADLKSNFQPFSSWVRPASGTQEDIPEDAVSAQCGYTDEGTKLLKSILMGNHFSYPKPLSLIRELLRQATGEDDTVLDFFAGSGTTAHAVLELNAEDGGSRRFIMVSNTEASEKDPEKNLCRDVCAERVRRVIAGYASPTKSDPKRRVDGTGGDFAYMRARTISVSDLDFGATDRGRFRHEHVWPIAAAVEGFPFTDGLPEQVADGVWAVSASEEDGRSHTLAYMPEPVPGALPWLRKAAKAGAVTVWTWTPTSLKGMPANVRVVALPETIQERWR